MQFTMRLVKRLVAGTIIPLSIAALLLGCAASRMKPPPPGDPSLPEIDVLQLKENSEEALRLAQENRLELQSMNSKMKEIETRLSQLSDAVSSLPLDRFDTLNHGLGGLQSQIDALNERVSKIPNAPPPIKFPATFSPNPDFSSKSQALTTPPPQASPSKPEKAQKAGATEAQLYKKAFDLFYGGDYRNARKSFQSLLDQYPKGAYADNSQYWIGECEFSLGQYANALKAFNQVLEYPSTEKSDDAQLKIGYAFLRLGDKKSAAEAFKKLLSLYPDSEYLERAKDELGKLE